MPIQAILINIILNTEDTTHSLFLNLDRGLRVYFGSSALSWFDSGGGLTVGTPGITNNGPARIGGETFFTNSISILGGALRGLTNNAPADAITPIAWIVFTNLSGGASYRIPLHQ